MFDFMFIFAKLEADCKHGRVPKSCQESIHILGIGRISGLFLMSGCIRLLPNSMSQLNILRRL